MTDAISIVQFVIPIMVWLVFFILSLSYLRETNDLYEYLAGLTCSAIATVCAFAIPYFWIGLTTLTMFVSFGLLFMVMGFISILFCLVFIILMLMAATSPMRRQEQTLTLR